MFTLGPSTGYLACLVCVLVIYKVADGSGSAFATVSAALQLLSLSFKVICTSIHDGPLNALGISKSAVLLETWALGCRLMSTLQCDGYVPVDPSGDFLYQALDVCSLLLAVWLFSRLYALQRRARAVTPHTEISVTPAIMTAFMLAALFHGDDNLLPFIDMAWMAGFILGALALVPQFFHIASGKLMNRWILHSLIATSCAWAASGVLLMYAYGIAVIGRFSAFNWVIVVVYIAVLVLHAEFCFQYGNARGPARGLLASCAYLLRLSEATRSQPLKLNRGLRSCCIISGCLVALVILYSVSMRIEGENGSFPSMMIKSMMLLANVVFYTKGHGRSGLPRCVQETFAKFRLCVGTRAEAAATGKKLGASKATVETSHKSGKHRKVTSRPAPVLLGAERFQVAVVTPTSSCAPHSAEIRPGDDQDVVQLAANLIASCSPHGKTFAADIDSSGSCIDSSGDDTPEVVANADDVSDVVLPAVSLMAFMVPEPLPIKSRRQSLAVAKQELVDGDSCSGLGKPQKEKYGEESSRTVTTATPVSNHSPSGSEFEEDDRCANAPSIQTPILLDAAPQGVQWFTDGERSFEPLVSPTGQLFYTDGVQVFMLACVPAFDGSAAFNPEHGACVGGQEVENEAGEDTSADEV
jgi:hypothetical protein